MGTGGEGEGNRGKGLLKMENVLYAYMNKSHTRS